MPLFNPMIPGQPPPYGTTTPFNTTPNPTTPPPGPTYGPMTFQGQMLGYGNNPAPPGTGPYGFWPGTGQPPVSGAGVAAAPVGQQPITGSPTDLSSLYGPTIPNSGNPANTGNPTNPYGNVPTGAPPSTVPNNGSLSKVGTGAPTGVSTTPFPAGAPTGAGSPVSTGANGVTSTKWNGQYNGWQPTQPQAAVITSNEAWYQNLLQGRNPYGSFNMDGEQIMQTPDAGGGGGDNGYTAPITLPFANYNGMPIINGKPMRQLGTSQDVYDPSKVTYDPQFGLVTEPENLKPVDDGGNTLIGTGIMAALGGLGLYYGPFGGTGAGFDGSGDFNGGGFGGLDGSEGTFPEGNPLLDSNGLPVNSNTTLPFGPPDGGTIPGGNPMGPDGSTLTVPPPSSTTPFGLPPGVTNAATNTGVNGLLNTLLHPNSGAPTGGPGGAPDLSTFLNSLLGNGLNYSADNQNVQQFQHQIDTLLDRGDPFGANNNRQQYLDQLSALYKDPSSVENTPGYKFALDQGTQNLQRTEAARGMGLSGNEMGDITKFGTGLASQTFNQERNALMQMAGANFNPADSAGRGMTAAAIEAAARQNRNSNLANLLTGNNGTGGANSIISSIISRFLPNANTTDLSWLTNLFNGGAARDGYNSNSPVDTGTPDGP